MDRHLRHDRVVGEVAVEGERRVPLAAGAQPPELLQQVVPVLRQRLAQACVFLLVRAERLGRRAQEGPRVRGQPVDEALEHAGAPFGDAVLPPQPQVFLHERRQREEQPRIVADVVGPHAPQIPPVEHRESPPEVAPQDRGLGPREVRPVRAVQRPDLLQQPGIGALVRVEMGDGHEHQRLRARHELVSASAGALKMAQQPGDPVQVLVRVALVPRPHDHQREHVEEVVIQKQRLDARRGAGRRRLLHEAVQHEHGGVLPREVVLQVVPRVQDVESLLAGAQVEVAHEAVEDERREAPPEDVGAHPPPQPVKPLRASVRGAGAQNLPPGPAGERLREERTGSFEAGRY